MEMRIASAFAIFLISLATVNARNKIELISMDEVSRKPENAATNLRLFGKTDKLSSEVCHIFPSSLEHECLETTRTYLHQTQLILQELLREESLCNITGLCHEKSMSPSNIGFMVKNTIPMKLHTKGCSTCRWVAREVLEKLSQAKTKRKVLGIILECCEELDENEKECKQAMRKYGPKVLSELVHQKPNVLCHKFGICE